MNARSSTSSATVRPILVFDGTCNLCVRSIRFILEHEQRPTLRFAPLQTRTGAQLMLKFGFSAQDAKTFVLIADERAYVKSDAAIRVARELRGRWKLLGLLRLVPGPLRDWAYDVIARNRYRWFGRREACMVPAPEVKARFIEE
jgi:predicted DCC family thiol-disulfide oxidoreductase YuxK